MTEPTSKLAEVVAEAAVSAAFQFASDFGSRVLLPRIEKWTESPQQPGEVPLKSLRNAPFAVIGLGHCGCHVTAQLGELLSAGQDPASMRNRNWFQRLVGTESKVPAFDPILVLGDIEDLTLGAVERSLSESVRSKILRIDFKPLQSTGVGHVPMFGEFVANGLLALPANDPSYGELDNWTNARLFLVENAKYDNLTSKLLFYVFSTGGGTGSGSAAELLRAQRAALAMHSQRATAMYFTGVGVLPTSRQIKEDRRMAINTGRAIVQYLADLNLRLNSKEEYSGAPQYDYSLRLKSKAKIARQVEGDGGGTIIRSWDGLALISNDITYLQAEESTQREDVLDYANQYIAQQVYNVFSSQADLPSESQPSTTSVKRKYDKVSRIDPQDLRTFLLGPYATCFAASDKDDATKPSWLTNMFCRAISIPALEQRDNAQLIEGISVLPQGYEDYKRQCTALSTACGQKGEVIDCYLSAEVFSHLRELPMFKCCRGVVSVFTSPRDGVIPADLDERLAAFLGRLLPNMTESRLAVVRGTTKSYTLSIFIQGSVIFSPAIWNSIRTYLMLCWKPRFDGQDQFSKRFLEFMNQVPPIKLDAVTEYFGLTEECYMHEVSDFDTKRQDFESNWREVVSELQGVNDGEKRALNEHTVSNMLVSSKQIRAAISFINYLAHYQRLDQFSDDSVVLASPRP